MRSRFDPALLDPENPFEIDDGNRPHLAKHAPFTETDLFDAWTDPGAVFLPAAADGPADWLLVASIPGDMVQVPLAPSSSSDSSKCRPIGLYRASREQIIRYREENR
ncbi:MAG TPA: hypothetical protein VGK51_17730 [Actinomycetota bacterium]